MTRRVSGVRSVRRRGRGREPSRPCPRSGRRGASPRHARCGPGRGSPSSRAARYGRNRGPRSRTPPAGPPGRAARGGPRRPAAGGRPGRTPRRRRRRGGDGHNLWASQRALDIAHITASTPDPVGGKIVKGADGKPTGVLKDDAQPLVSRHIPEPDETRLADTAAKILAEAAASGITTFMEAVVGRGELDLYRRLAESGRLPQRIVPALRVDAEPTKDPAAALAYAEGLRAEFEDVRGLRFGTVKVFLDGVIEYPARTAALLKPYLDKDGRPTDNRGDLYVSAAELRTAQRRLQRRGLADARARHRRPRRAHLPRRIRVRPAPSGGCAPGTATGGARRRCRAAGRPGSSGARRSRVARTGWSTLFRSGTRYGPRSTARAWTARAASTAPRKGSAVRRPCSCTPGAPRVNSVPTMSPVLSSGAGWSISSCWTAM